ncbi:MAG: ATP synthase F1 subunit delta [Myxococcaceae bacterium]
MKFEIASARKALEMCYGRRRMANVTSVARRYARALLEATGPAEADAVAQQLSTLATAFSDHAELTQVFENPAISQAQRMAVVEGLLKQISPLHASVNALAHILVKRGRISVLSDIALTFRDFADARAGRVRGELTSAIALSPDVAKRVEQALERAMQRDVVLSSRIDPSLVGGVSARVGPLTFDGSLKMHLETLRRQLKQT